VEIRIGITNSPREISFETTQSASDVQDVIAQALEAGKAFFSLTDSKGKIYLVPTVNLGYVEIGSEESRRIGFVG
jgi:hypothetical protein